MPDTHLTGTRHRPSILVTGASGNLGSEVAARLLARGAHVRTLDRRRSSPRPGVESVVGDLTDPAVLREALTGIDAVFLIWPLLDSAPARPLVAELRAARVVYVSSAAIDDLADRQSDPIVQVHADMEALLRDGGVRPVVLRSDTLASNTRGWTSQLLAGDVVSGPDMAPTPVVDERDVADAAVAVLLAPRDEPDRGPYVLTGPEVLSRADLVARLGAALGRPLRFEPVPAELARARMLADGRPEPLVEALITAAVARPPSSRVTGDVERLTGRPAGTFAGWAAAHAAEFNGPDET
ncbi:NAD(P)H-binding protein [Actinomadura decatromicini]|uniref:NAD(P)H-binding protein n=1 Tax=Actinomadura decatromicini TaxID=2604572 RepID=A0A5D3FW27_9ACTN|nr:NAD(P)H-binding protein [Actinomadura decatromicini]TYK51345.1 NAD(P)H-binding protein [Actinomadura decatromicini]